MEIQLVELCIGKAAMIKQIDGGYDIQRRLTSLGIRLDQTIVKVGSGLFKSPVVIKVDRAKIAIGKEIAINIFVEELQT